MMRTPIARISSSAGVAGIVVLLAAGAPAGQARQAPVQPPVAAISPYIDVHTHIEREVAETSVERAVEAMRANNTARYLFLPSPFDEQNARSFDIEFIRAAAKAHPDAISASGGGGTLNPMIQEAVRSGAVSAELQARFRARAEDIASLGASGFGELTAEHRPSASTPSYQSSPPDHPLLLLLADIAAEHNLPITLHMEAVPETMPIPDSWRVNSLPAPPQLRANIAAFERLLAHNPRANIVWAHQGWDNTGYRTPQLSRRLLQAHPNLYLELKIDPLGPGRNSPLSEGASGVLKPEWLRLFRDFPDRFVIGSDQHFPMPDNGSQRWQAIVLLFNQLPSDLRQKIGLDNPARLFHLNVK
jgi:predicted TIM-barrel fold metal-dependent hydrolase